MLKHDLVSSEKIYKKKKSQEEREKDRKTIIKFDLLKTRTIYSTKVWQSFAVFVT